MDRRLVVSKAQNMTLRMWQISFDGVDHAIGCAVVVAENAERAVALVKLELENWDVSGLAYSGGEVSVSELVEISIDVEGAHVLDEGQPELAEHD